MWRRILCIGRFAVMAGTLLAPMAARALVVIDDFGVSQQAGSKTSVPDPFLWRTLGVNQGSVRIAAGELAYERGLGASIFYANARAPSDGWDFSAARTFKLRWSTAGDFPSLSVRLFSGGRAADTTELLLPGRAASPGTVIQTFRLEDLLLRASPGFDIGNVTGLKLELGPLAIGGGPVRIDEFWISGTLTPVPEAPPALLLAAGLACVAALARRRLPAHGAGRKAPRPPQRGVRIGVAAAS
jgi:hypothetical protein